MRVLVGAAVLSSTMATISSKPNVLIFLIDDMGYSDIASFGRQNVSTPHLDHVVAQGMKFTQVSCDQLQCHHNIATTPNY